MIDYHLVGCFCLCSKERLVHTFIASFILVSLLVQASPLHLHVGLW